MSREAMQMALKYLSQDDLIEARLILRLAIKQAEQAQPEQEPVAWMVYTLDGKSVCVTDNPSDFTPEHHALPLYTAPPKREWVGLTDQEVMVAAYQAGFDIHEDYENEDDPEAMHWWTPDGEACDDSLLKLRDLIESKLKEKNKW